MSALHHFFTAKSIAVIGASAHREKVGYQVLNNLLHAQKHGHAKRKIFPINPTASTILGLPVSPSIFDVHHPINLVIIVTPAPTVAGLLDQIIERNRNFSKDKKVKAVIIISAGFAETDKKGKEVQHMIATKLQLAGIELLGPNTLGLLHPLSHLNASFAQKDIPDGNLAFISQSGAMLTAMFNALEQRSIGVSFAVSLGNKAGISENDCLEYALHDPHTDVVVLYLESFTHLPHFFELTSKISKKKPVLLLKGGTSMRGQKASASHTAALATNQVLLEAASRQMGFTLVENMEELLNTAFFLAQHRELPENTMIITNAGGPAVNTVDETERNGVSLAKWSRQSLSDLSALLPQIHQANPLDLLGDASPDRFRLALQIAQHDLHIESMVIIITPQAVTDIPAIVDELIAYRGKKPIFVALIGGDNLERYRQKLRQHHVFCTGYPNDIINVLKLTTHLKAQQYQKGSFVVSEPHTPKHPPEIYPLKFLHKRPLPRLDETFELLQSVGFHVPRYALIRTHNFYQLIHMNYPVFAKTANQTILHKKKLGAIYGIVQNVAEAETAYQQLKAFGNEVLFQQIIEIDQEILLGVENDPQFGLYMTVGLGGSYTNILADRAYVFLPAHKADLKNALLRTKAANVLSAQPELIDRVVEQMQNLQKLIMRNPWISMIEINPLVINKKGIWAADVKVGVK